MSLEYIALEGEKYTIEWYYDIDGKIPALEYLEGLDTKRKVKVFYLFQMMALTGRINNIEKFRNEHDEIYAFKPQPDRFLCFFFEGKKIIVTNAFEKRQDKLPLNEKGTALAFKKDYEIRCKKGIYYEK